MRSNRMFTLGVALLAAGVVVGQLLPSSVAQAQALAAFMKAGGAVVVCQHCMQARTVQAPDLMGGLTVGGEGGALQAFLTSTRSIPY